MKKIIIYILTGLLFTGCSKLDLQPLSQGSSENWYSTETEFEMAVNDLFREVFWPRDNDLWSDDLSFRGEVNAMVAGTLNAETGTVESRWNDDYKAIARATKIIENIEKVRGMISDAKLLQYEANAKFVRAARYADLISHWGDVPLLKNTLTLEEAYQQGRSSREDVLNFIYEDYDFAIANLPQSYGSAGNRYGTKGAALALKARIALYMQDYTTARDAAKACIDLNQYTLHPDFRTQFLTSTKNSPETIFAIPRSVELGFFEDETKYYISRLAGGFGSRNPTYGLFSAFLCEDGKPIDESPLYDPKNPFANRDPRLTETFVEHQTPWLGFIFNPHPDTLDVLNVKTGAKVRNNDNRARNINAPFNGLLMKKGIDEDYSDDFRASPDLVVARYADVLLMYAEAKIELNELDNTVTDAINQVRARAYKKPVASVSEYPAVTLQDQGTMRKELRFERRMELALEGLRYMDLMRWRLAEIVFNTPEYGMLDVAELRTRVVQQGLWFFPGVPEVDENTLADFTDIFDAGLLKLYGIRSFDAGKNYLWPIPAKDVLINSNIKQNPNY